MKTEKMYMKAYCKTLQPSTSNIIVTVTVTVCCEFGVKGCFLILRTPGAPGKEPDASGTRCPRSPWLVCFQEERCGAGTRQVQDGHDVSEQPATGCHSAETEPLAAA